MNINLRQTILGALVLTALNALSVSVESGTNQAVVPHSVPLDFLSDRYGVTVNGKPVQVFLAAMNVHFASFDFTGTADVQVTINKQDYHRRDKRQYLTPDEFWQSNAVVRPLARDVKAATQGRVVKFSLSQPGQYSVERPGTGWFEDEVLFLFSNRPETEVPSSISPNVVWIGPGLHQRSVDLTNGQTLYLAAGAVLFGSINIREAENVRVCGRGTVVYSGPNSRNLNTNYKPDRNWHPLLTCAVKGLAVEGVTFVNRCRTMTLCLWLTENATFDNIKVIAALPENLQADGVDWFGGGHTAIRNSLIRAADDCFAIFSADNVRALAGYERYQPGSGMDNPTVVGALTDITIERCVLWTTSANIFRAGWNAFTSRNVAMRDCDIIHFNTGFKSPEYLNLYHSLFRATGGRGDSLRRHSNYLFEDIRFEEDATLLAVNSPQVALRNVCFKDIQLLDGLCPSVLRGDIDGVLFQNVQVVGRPATTATDLKLTVGSEAKNVRFLPLGNEPGTQ